VKKDRVTFFDHHALRQIVMADPKRADGKVKIGLRGSFILKKFEVDFAGEVWTNGVCSFQRLVPARPKFLLVSR